MLTIARLDEDGRTALTVYAKTASVIPVEHSALEFGKAQVGQKEETGHIQWETVREGRLLAGNTVAREVFALREARRQRQDYIEQAKEGGAWEEAKEGTAGGEPEKEQGLSEVKLAGQKKSEEKLSQEESSRGPGVEEEKEDSQQVSSVISYSQQDYEVLKRIVEAEAGICDTKGRILVANVVINRVRSDEFPDTITGVVYQKSQFSPVNDGSLNSCIVTPETVEAVDRALAGEDYSQGALYFMNRVRSRSGNVSWFDRSLTFLFQHDRHEFFK
ncbi:MAG: cell wall hydrolase [Lachnospiraceae bacterium]|nr:cell wall hydrolase [Lachnospiraceae bacterium]